MAECGRRDWIPHASNCREALQDALYHIRFSLIPQKVFAKIQCPMLSEEGRFFFLTHNLTDFFVLEIIDIFLSYNGDVKSDFQFSTVPRWGTGSRETKFENSFKSVSKVENGCGKFTRFTCRISSWSTKSLQLINRSNSCWMIFRNLSVRW